MSDERDLFARRNEPDARSELVARYDDLAGQLARKFRGRGESVDDLHQVARAALLGAIDRFDVERGVAFSTFSGRTIVGELKRHLRDKAWSVRVPRSLQEKVLEVTRAVQDLTQRLGRSPTLREIATEVGSDIETVIEALEAGNAYTAASVDAPAGGDDDAPTIADSLGGADGDLEGAADRMTVEALLARLPERERTIVVQRFFDGRTQSEIADSVGISQMHVSRLLRSSLRELRAQLTEA